MQDMNAGSHGRILSSQVNKASTDPQDAPNATQQPASGGFNAHQGLKKGVAPGHLNQSDLME